MNQEKRWRKLLYVVQDYPDNYVDPETFLVQMKQNANVKIHQYWPTVRKTCAVTSQISCVCLFISTFVHLHIGNINTKALLWISCSLTTIGYWMHARKQQKVSVLKAVKATVLFIITLLGLSPILKTLTEDTSNDTIYALTTILFTGNLLFHYYDDGEADRNTEVKYPGSLSLNAAIFGSVLLASRLGTSQQVFALMLFAVQTFALFPLLRRTLMPKYGVHLTGVLLVISSLLLYPINRLILSLHIGLFVFVTFACPLWLIWLQKYKHEIIGPWDELKPILKE